MVANFIASFLSGYLFVLSFIGLCRAALRKTGEYDPEVFLVLSIVGIFAAWICAKIGGI